MINKERKLDLKIILFSFVASALVEIFVPYAFEEKEIPHSELIYNIFILGILSSIFLEILFRLPSISNVEDTVDNTVSVIDNISNDIKQIMFDFKVNSKIKSLKSLTGFRDNMIVSEFGLKIFEDYMKKFSIKSDPDANGFSVEGEQFALESYAKFWKKLTEIQKKRKLNNEKCLIARATHSNDIDIWSLDSKPHTYLPFKQDLYDAQEEFIKNDGIIVRIIIGEKGYEDIINNPSCEYENTIKSMDKIGIETKYLSKSDFEAPEYDFLYLADEQIVLKWYSTSGLSLSGFTIQDTVEDKVISAWERAYKKLEKLGRPITKIPLTRQYFDDERPTFNSK